MDFGQAATIWLARASAAAWLLVIYWRRPSTRRVWTCGLVLYLLHVVGAFACFYEWSHAVVRETARQTRELLEWIPGGGCI